MTIARCAAQGLRGFSPWARPVLIGLALVAGCSSGGGKASGTGGGTQGGDSGGAGGAGGVSGEQLPFSPCSLQTRVGGFTLDLKHAVDTVPAFWQVNGSVRDKINPNDVWRQLAAAGECRVMVGLGLNCTPACTGDQVCMGNNVCIAAPVSHGVGAVSVSGLVTAVALMPMGIANAYSGPVPTNYVVPPYALGASVGLQAAGAGTDYPAFSLAARGIAPLEVPAGQTLAVGNNQPLTVAWAAPETAGAGRVALLVNVAHHGSVAAARLECDVADTGSATIPGPLLAMLVAQGTSGFPTITVTRRSVASTTIPSGCVDFTIQAAIELPVTVDGVTSCNDEMPCPSPQVCSTDGTLICR